MAQPTLLMIDDTVLGKCYFLRARRLSKNFYKAEKALKITDKVLLFLFW